MKGSVDMADNKDAMAKPPIRRRPGARFNPASNVALPPIRRRPPSVAAASPPDVKTRKRSPFVTGLLAVILAAAIGWAGYNGWRAYRAYQADRAAQERAREARAAQVALKARQTAVFEQALNDGEWDRARAVLDEMSDQGFDLTDQARAMEQAQLRRKRALAEAFAAAETAGDADAMTVQRSALMEAWPTDEDLEDWATRIKAVVAERDRRGRIDRLWADYRQRLADRELYRADRALASLGALGADTAGERAKLVRTVRLPGGGDMRFRWIPPGEFLMGSPDSEAGRSADEARRRVTLSKGFWLGETEVTQAQWASVTGHSPSEFEGAKRPVENVTWRDVLGFINRMNEAAGRQRYRLPTEAEWEYACRAGAATPFYTGSRLSADQANYDGNYPYGGGPKGVYRRETSPVASFAPNAWGLYDMHGNVWEWIADRYAPYENGPVVDPQGADLIRYTERVVRGGGWGDFAERCRCAARFKKRPRDHFNVIGFRVVSEP